MTGTRQNVNISKSKTYAVSGEKVCISRQKVMHSQAKSHADLDKKPCSSKQRKACSPRQNVLQPCYLRTCSTCGRTEHQERHHSQPWLQRHRCQSEPWRALGAWQGLPGAASGNCPWLVPATTCIPSITTQDTHRITQTKVTRHDTYEDSPSGKLGQRLIGFRRTTSHDLELCS